MRRDTKLLNNCLVEQPVLFQEVSAIYAKYLAEKDYLYAEYKREYGRLFVEYKRSGEKVTEKMIDSLIVNTESYIDIKNKYLKKLEEVNKWAALKEAFAQRNYMLKELSNLFSTNYYTRDNY